MKKILLWVLIVSFVLSTAFVGIGCKEEAAATEETKEEAATEETKEEAATEETKEEAATEETKEEAATEETKETGPISGGSITVVVQAEPPHLDETIESQTFTNEVTQSINDRLVKSNRDLEIEPRLAKSWEWLSDLELKMTLREGVKFHNGRELVANDVKESILRSSGEGSDWANYLSSIESIDVLDDYNFVINLSEPFGGFLAGLVSVPITPPEAFDDLATNPIGCGPFKFVSWDIGSKITVERFDDYWEEGKPYLDEIEFIFLSDEVAQIAGLMNGEIDMLTRPTPSQIVSIMNGDIGGVKLDDGSLTPSGGYAVIFNMGEEPLKSNLELRQAIAYAIDREEISEIVFDNLVPISASYINQASPYYNPEWEDIITYNPEKAKDLLVEAGYPDGIDLKLSISGLAQYKGMAEVLQQQFAGVGINIEIEVLEGAAFTERVFGNRDYAMTIAGSTAPNDPSLLPLYRWVTSSNSWVQMSDEKLDQIVDKISVTIDFEERYKLVDELERYVIGNAMGVICLAGKEVNMAISDKLEGWSGVIDAKNDYSGIWMNNS